MVTKLDIKLIGVDVDYGPAPWWKRLFVSHEDLHKWLTLHLGAMIRIQIHGKDASQLPDYHIVAGDVLVITINED